MRRPANLGKAFFAGFLSRKVTVNTKVMCSTPANFFSHWGRAEVRSVGNVELLCSAPQRRQHRPHWMPLEAARPNNIHRRTRRPLPCQWERPFFIRDKLGNTGASVESVFSQFPAHNVAPAIGPM